MKPMMMMMMQQQMDHGLRFHLSFPCAGQSVSLPHHATTLRRHGNTPTPLISPPFSSRLTSTSLFEFAAAPARILNVRSSSSENDGAYAEQPEQGEGKEGDDDEEEVEGEEKKNGEGNPNSGGKTRPKEFRSSWDAKDSQGNDYLFTLGQESANMNISVGARQGIVDDLFVGNFLGKDGIHCFYYHYLQKSVSFC